MRGWIRSPNNATALTPLTKTTVDGLLYGGYALRKRLKEKTKSKYADLSPQMKQSGFQCNRCEHQFIPAA